MATKQTHKGHREADPSTAGSSADPWTPQMDRQPEFNPFANIESAARSPGATLPLPANPPMIRAPAIDTAPLQGMRDLTDQDSLTDVIAAGRTAGAQMVATSTKPPRKTLSVKPRKPGIKRRRPAAH